MDYYASKLNQASIDRPRTIWGEPGEALCEVSRLWTLWFPVQLAHLGLIEKRLAPVLSFEVQVLRNDSPAFAT